MNRILAATDAISLFEAGGGGKAKHLARLVALGFDVPRFVCVSTAAFDEAVAAAGIDLTIRPDDDLAARSKQIEGAFLAARLPAGIMGDVRAALDGLGLRDTFIAVRSSALDEDSAANSFAGQLSSFLHRRGETEILDALKRCWASGFSERALVYRRERGVSLEGIRVAVVLQEMVDAEAAGVVFSRDPTHPLDRETIVVSSVWGLGEGLVSGELDADHFNVIRGTEAITAHVVDKEHGFFRAAPSGIEKRAIDAEKRGAPSLDDDQVRAVAALAVKLERSFGSPQDAEWAYAAGTLRVLQTRPITSLPPDAFFAPTVGGEAPILWDNSNIIESYCGVTSPLTFSFVSRAYARVYEQFGEVMGVPDDVLAAHRPVFQNMLGLVRGRVYYNLVNWYRLILMFPSSANANVQMETMMGVKQGLVPEVAAQFEAQLTPPRYGFWRKLSVAIVASVRLLFIRGIIDRFVAHFSVVYEENRKKDLGGKSIPELVHHVKDVEERLLSRWQAPIVNDTRCMVFFGSLKQLTQKWIAVDGGNGTLQNDLLCGQGDVESTEPTKALMRLARVIAEGDAAYRESFVTRPSSAVWADLRADRGPVDVRRGFAEFLDKYGFRCVNELKLEEPDLHDDPTFAIEAIASYVRMGNTSTKGMEEREAQIRDKAEAVVRSQLSGFRKVMYFWVLRNARVAVRDRENLRFLRTKVFGLLRRGYRAIGAKLVELRVLDDAADVFYLTTDEVGTFAEGRAVTLDLRGLVALRRAEYDGYRRTAAPPDRFVTHGTAGAAMLHPQVLADADLLRSENVSDDPDVLLGTSCCPGVVEGPVRVVRSLADAQGLNGEILVTERTDPGWVPLYPSCSGLLIERGSLLSHSAVVARELGLPTIVGISGGMMNKLETGARVKVDAGKGEVRILR